MKLTKAQWIERYGGPALIDARGLEVVPCLECDDVICHGWRVVLKSQLRNEEIGVLRRSLAILNEEQSHIISAIESGKVEPPRILNSEVLGVDQRLSTEDEPGGEDALEQARR